MFPTPRPRYPLPALLATGQLTSYGSGTGVDDGALQKGIAKAYEILTLGQYSGTTNIKINDKTDVHSNNCVRDLNTGLMWSRYVSASVGPASDGKIPWTTNANGEGIFPYCAAANAALLAGYGDWRVPNDVELPSLRDMEQPKAQPNTVAFPSIPNQVYFTSTTNPENLANAMTCSLNSSGAVSHQVRTATGLLLLVRG
jgi:hypothetical protein